MEMLFNGRRDGRKWERAHRPQTLGIIQVVKNREPTNPSTTYFNCRIEFSLADLFPHFIFCFERKTFGIRIFHYNLSPNTVGPHQGPSITICCCVSQGIIVLSRVWCGVVGQNPKKQGNGPAKRPTHGAMKIGPATQFHVHQCQPTKTI